MELEGGHQLYRGAIVTRCTALCHSDRVAESVYIR